MNRTDNYLEFCASLEQLDIKKPQEEAVSFSAKKAIGDVYGHVKEFMVETNLVPSEQLASIENFGQSVRNLNSTVALTDIGAERIMDLCQACGIDDRNLRAAIESVSLCINNYSNNYDLAQHFNAAPPSDSHGQFEMKSLNTMYSQAAIESLAMTPQAAVESFGTGIDNVVTDAKVAITVAILRFHRSALHRLIPNIPSTSNVVTFKVDNMEVYDLTKSRNRDAGTRYDDKHRTPFLDLYHDPSPANATLKPILLRTANDPAAPDDKLVAENIAKIGQEVNMFDYSLDATTIGYQNIDYTDLVGDNVRIKSLYIDVFDGTTHEMIPVSVVTEGGSRMVMSANNDDSADRICSLSSRVALDADTAMVDTTISTILAGLSSDAFIEFNYNASGAINLKTSNVVVHGSGKATIKTKSGNSVIAADQTLFDGLTIQFVGYEIDAKFSEENIRKTTRAMRIQTKQFGYEIPGSDNSIVQYSLTQSRPETVVDALTKLMAVGIDDRGIKLMLDTMAEVKDRITAEAKFGDDNNYTKKIGMNFVAGQRVRPYIYLDNLAIDPNVANMRSEEMWGDVRSYAEKYIMEVLVRIYNESFYTNEIGMGEKPVFNVLTSGYIKDALLSVPHYHNLLADTAADAVADGAVEFRRTLPNGTVLNVMSTTFDYMTDKMLMIPTRPNSPRSTLNFAHNLERGTYLTQATPSMDNAIYNQLIGNAREFPIVLNPIGALLTVSGLSAVFNDNGALGV